MKYCVLGAGRQGAAIVYDLAKFGDSDEILLLDNSPHALDSVKERLGKLVNTSIITSTIDVANHNDLVAKLEDINLILLDKYYKTILYFTEYSWEIINFSELSTYFIGVLLRYSKAGLAFIMLKETCDYRGNTVRAF